MEINRHENQLIRLKAFSATVTKQDYKSVFPTSLQHIQRTLALLNHFVDTPFKSSTFEESPMHVQISGGKIQTLSGDYLTLQKIVERIDPKIITAEETQVLERLLDTLEELEADIYRNLEIDKGRENEWTRLAVLINALTASLKNKLEDVHRSQ